VVALVRQSAWWSQIVRCSTLSGLVKRRGGKTVILPCLQAAAGEPSNRTGYEASGENRLKCVGMHAYSFACYPTMNLDAPFVPPDLFPEYFPPTNTDTSGTTGTRSTAITFTIDYFCHPVVNPQATTVWQTPGISGMSMLHALRVHLEASNAFETLQTCTQRGCKVHLRSK
jgi:hypothetical protein